MLVEETGMARLRGGVLTGAERARHAELGIKPRLRRLELLIRQVVRRNARNAPALADVLPCHGQLLLRAEGKRLGEPRLQAECGGDVLLIAAAARQHHLLEPHGLNGRVLYWRL